MPVGAQGSALRVLMRLETTEGTAATGDYDQVPVYGIDLSASQDLQDDQVLSAGSGRDAGDPFLDVLRVQGRARIPVDLVNIGYWLRLMFGAPVTTGTSPNYTHTFTSGAATLPTATIEKGQPDAASYELLTGVRAGGLTIDFSPQGAADATVDLIGLGATVTGTSVDATPTIAAGFTRFLKKQGSITKDGSAMARVTGAQISLSNNAAEVRTIRSDDRLEGTDIGQFTAGGQVTVRFSSPALLTQASAFTASTMALAYVIDANRSLTFNMSRVFFQRTGIAVNGPGGIELPVQMRASGAQGSMLTAVLKNQVATY